jgi:hypothetical protein
VLVRVATDPDDLLRITEETTGAVVELWLRVGGFDPDVLARFAANGAFYESQLRTLRPGWFEAAD